MFYLFVREPGFQLARIIGNYSTGFQHAGAQVLALIEGTRIQTDVNLEGMDQGFSVWCGNKGSSLQVSVEFNSTWFQQADTQVLKINAGTRILTNVTVESGD